MSWTNSKFSRLLISAAMIGNVVTTPVLAEEPEVAPEEPEVVEVQGEEVAPEETPAEETPAEEAPEETPAAPEVVTLAGTQIPVLTPDDWGSGISATVITFEKTVSAASVSKDDFSVVEEKQWYGGNAALDRVVLDAYTSDAEGNKVDADSKYVTIQMYISPNDGSPFVYSGRNNWCNPYGLVVTLNEGESITAEGEEVTALAVPSELDPATTKISAQLKGWTINNDGFTSSAGNPISYGLYTPTNANDGEDHPLFIWNHGAGEYGKDVQIDMLCNEVTAFGQPEFQEIFGGAYVLVPQRRSSRQDGSNTTTADVKELIDKIVAENNIDTRRITQAGCSAGGNWTNQMVYAYPDLFAAYAPICPATTNVSDATIAKVAEVPVWFIHCVNDSTVRYNTSTKMLVEKLTEAGAEVHTSLYDDVHDTTGRFDNEDGTPYVYDTHWSWTYFDNNYCVEGDLNCWEWLAAQKKPALEGTQTPVLTADDWGSGISATVVKFEAKVDPESVSAEDFAVVEGKQWYSGYAELDRKVLDAYTSDAEGNKVEEASEYVTIEMYISPDEGSPFIYTGGRNNWCNPYGLAVSLTEGATVTAEGTTYKTLDVESKLNPATDKICAQLDGWTINNDGFTSSAGNPISYGLYTPANADDGAKHPLFIWNHGAGEYGKDVQIDMLCNEVTAFGQPEFQEIFGGAYVLVPQRRSSRQDGSNTTTADVKELIDKIVEENNVDILRITEAGCSAGGNWTDQMVYAYPDLFAAYAPICPATNSSSVSDATIEAVAHVPVWFIHCVNDGTVRYPSTTKLLAERLEAAGAEVHTSLYDDVHDTTGRFDNEDGTPHLYDTHWSWTYFDNNYCVDGDLNCWEWLAAQVKEDTRTVVDFKLGAEVFDYGESINTVTIELPGVDPESVTTDTFKVVASAVCEPVNNTVAYKDVERTVTAVTVTDDAVVLELACEFGGAGEGTLSYLGGINQLNTVTYEVTLNNPIVVGEEKCTNMTAKFAQDGQWTDPEVDAFTAGKTGNVEWRLFTPENAEDGEKHPLIVWLHGAGESASATAPNNYSQLAANRGALGFTLPENQEKFGGAYVLAPQAPANGRWNEANLGDVVAKINELVATGTVDEDQINVSGCSMGGGGTVRIATTWPEIWNAVAPICPAVGGEATDDIIVNTMGHQNVFLIHATNDPTVNVSSSYRIHNLLDCEFAEYPTVNYGGVEYPGHWSWIYMAQNDPTTEDGTDFMTWMASQRKIETVDAEFTLGAHVFDYGESINSVTINLAGVDPESVTVDTFKVVSSAVCEPANNQRAYTNVVRTVKGVTVTDDTVVLELATAYGGAGEGTLTYTGGINQLNTVSYQVLQKEEITVNGETVKPSRVQLTQKGQWSDPEVDAFTTGRVNNVSYRLYIPENYNDGAEHPLIVWLHGSGETASATTPNNYSQIAANRGALGFTEPENQELFGGAFVLAPQAPASGRWNVANLSDVVDTITLLQGKYNIDADQISVSGCSMGGGGTVRIATTFPEIWNAVVPICPAVGGEATDEVVKSTMGGQNVFLIHSENDPTVNVASSRRLDSLLKYNEYYEYETVTVDGVEYPGHWSWIYMANNDPTAADGTPFMTWLANQRRIGEIEEGPAGATVTADANSPTGYTVTFVFDATESEKEVTKVEVSGPFNYTDKWNVINEDGTNGSWNNADPYGFVNGMYASNAHGDGSGVWGYTAELTDKDADGVFCVAFPIASGSYGYTYTVTYADGTSEKMADPANPANVDGKMNPEGNKNSGDTNSSVVKGHWDPEKQSDSPNMDYVLPVEDEAAKGTLSYVEYEALGGKKSHLGVYLPAGYDANREQPYKTIYISHGGGGDETDWFHMGSADDTMDNLVAAGETEAAVIVTMDNTMYGWDYTKTLPNMLEVVIPFIEENYNVSTAVEDRALMGLSAGGMNTGEMFVEHPEAFGYFLMMSGGQTPTEWNDDYAKPIVMVTVGTVDFASRREGNNGTIAGESLGDWCAENIPEHYVGEYMYIPGSHDWFVWPQSFATWLREVAWTANEVVEPEQPEDPTPVEPEKPEDKPTKPTKPSTGVDTGDNFNGGILGGMMAAFAGLAAAAWFALNRKH